MSGYQISPDHIPLPTAWNFPFHPSKGSHTSNRISESFVGLAVAATRQKAGSLSYAGFATMPSGNGLSGLNEPAGTVTARVIVVFGSAREAISLQGVGAVADPLPSMTLERTTSGRVNMVFIEAPLGFRGQA
jgi:hypothetical protein